MSVASREEIEAMLAEGGFAYHRVPLPHGLATPGQDRSQTAAIVLPEGLEGWTMLDVGCALGYFCFEAEKRGASAVTGLDLKPERLSAARRLAAAMDSRVGFAELDVFGSPGAVGEHDLVLALNLIHHLDDPFSAIATMASLARRRLVLEFPTFADPKFRKLGGSRLWRLYDRRPLVGVSSLRKVDQTFVFSPVAIRRALRDRGRGMGFASVEIVRSPMPGRAIAICDKRG